MFGSMVCVGGFSLLNCPGGYLGTKFVIASTLLCGAAVTNIDKEYFKCAMTVEVIKEL